jgi:hypothetical protein
LEGSNVKRHGLVWCCLPVLFAAATAAGQPAGPGSQGPPGRGLSEKDRLRLQIAAMEGVLSSAVTQLHIGALESVMPGVFTFEGGARARGFRLEGYGFFFDVELPALPRTVAWSLQMLGVPIEIDADIAQLQRQVQAVSDARLRQQFEQTIRNIQGKVTRVSARPDGTESSVMVAQRQGAPRAAGVEIKNEDPFKSYLGNLSNSLAEVLVTYGDTIQLGSDDWLTVAAREMQPRLMPGGPVETAITLRIKGSDLAALKAGRISHADAMKRVEIKEF